MWGRLLASQEACAYFWRFVSRASLYYSAAFVIIDIAYNSTEKVFCFWALVT
jgi:hypothetical protein